MRLPKPRVRRPVLSPNQIARVVQAATSVRERLIVLLTVQEALRPHEIASVLLADVDIGHSIIRVPGHYSRTVPISSETQRTLETYTGLRGVSAGPLILSRRRQDGLTADYIGKILRRLLLRSGVKQATRDYIDGTTLRHSAARHMVEAGADPAELGEALGHRGLTEPDVQHRPWPASDLERVMGGRSYT